MPSVPALGLVNLFCEFFERGSISPRDCISHVGLEPMLSIDAPGVLVELGGAGKHVLACYEELRAIVFDPAQVSNLGDTLASRARDRAKQTC